MNLYLRLIWTLLRARQQPALPVDGALERTFRVLPNDIDINGHMNNGRYLTLVDLMLIEFFVRVGFFRVLRQNGWRPMSGGSIITYRRGLKPFQKYTVRFRWIAQDTHWNFMRFEFVSAQGKLCAAGYMKGAAVSKTGLVTNAEAMRALGQNLAPRPLPASIEQWLASETALNSEVRAAASAQQLRV